MSTNVIKFSEDKLFGVSARVYTCKCCGKTIEAFTYGSINPLCLDCFKDMEEMELELLREYQKDRGLTAFVLGSVKRSSGEGSIEE